MIIIGELIRSNVDETRLRRKRLAVCITYKYARECVCVAVAHTGTHTHTHTGIQIAFKSWLVAAHLRKMIDRNDAAHPEARAYSTATGGQRQHHAHQYFHARALLSVTQRQLAASMELISGCPIVRGRRAQHVSPSIRRVAQR